jgi:hypothetical protein
MDIASCYMRRHHDEDSHFAHADAGVLGVADGVSGFRKKGRGRRCVRARADGPHVREGEPGGKIVHCS